jgi:hypothetical protein
MHLVGRHQFKLNNSNKRNVVFQPTQTSQVERFILLFVSVFIAFVFNFKFWISFRLRQPFLSNFSHILLAVDYLPVRQGGRLTLAKIDPNKNWKIMQSVNYLNRER